MARLGDLAGVWNTVRELNVGDIRENAEQEFTLALVGDTELREALAEVVRGTPGRFPAPVRDAVREFPLVLPRERPQTLIEADAVLVVVDGRRPFPAAALSTADKLAMLSQPRLVAIVGDRLPRTPEGDEPDLGGARVVFVADTSAAAWRDAVLPVLVELLPDDQRLAAGRRIAGLRDAVAQALINSTAFSNATYALTSGLPEMIPVLNLPLNAADMVVLTKNQALLTYKLALNYGAPGDFQAQMREILPVIGSGFVWRQLARQLIGLIPGFGLLPKVAVAYGGTYAVGQSATLWYSHGEVLSRSNLKQLYSRAIAEGKERARELIKRDEATAPVAPAMPGAPLAPRRGLVARLLDRLRRLFRRG